MSNRCRLIAAANRDLIGCPRLDSSPACLTLYWHPHFGEACRIGHHLNRQVEKMFTRDRKAGVVSLFSKLQASIMKLVGSELAWNTYIDPMD